MKKIALFGGTFDPVHIGHLLMARTALETMKFDKVIFIPSCVPPHKSGEMLFSVEDRFEMVKLAIMGNPQFEASDFEVKNGGRSYSLETVRYFRGLFPSEDKLYFVVGGDAAKGIENWKGVDEIKTLCSFVTANRPGYSRGDAKKKYPAVTMHGVDISSTEIRKRILAGKSVQYLVPDNVLDYIRKNHLYKIRG
ncbi:MAG: nicotinate-nucleotide adenylyltransferase [Candidatus Omnitrophica bacterium]|nr:nicotinate-nucleotide adenylyltransferase [Candidatus Omnitrophota bacterium]